MNSWELGARHSEKCCGHRAEPTTMPSLAIRPVRGQLESCLRTLLMPPETRCGVRDSQVPRGSFGPGFGVSIS